MGLFRWLKSRFEMAPYSRLSVVRCDGHVLELRKKTGLVVSLEWSDVQRILIRTTDMGRFDVDAFLVLETSERCFVIAKYSSGSEELFAHVQNWPRFDNKAVIDAMGCTSNKDFLCWERS